MNNHNILLTQIYSAIHSIGYDQLPLLLNGELDQNSQSELLILGVRYRDGLSEFNRNRLNQQDWATEKERIRSVLYSTLERLSEEQLIKVARKLSIGITLDTRQTSEKEQKLSILYVSASPIDHDALQIDREYRIIRDRLEAASNQARLQMSYPVLAASFGDLINAIQDIDPWLVHISGHADKGGIILADKTNKGALVVSKALVKLFSLKKYRISCLLLNGCLTSFPAKLISQKSIFVIGMKEKIEDRLAIDFADAFYRYLGKNGNLTEAYCLTTLELSARADFPAAIVEFWKDGKKFNCYTNEKTT